MHIRVAHFGLVDPFYAFGGENTDGDFLGDDCFTLGGTAGVETLFVEVVVGEGVVNAAVAEEAITVPGADGVGYDCQGEDRITISLCEAQRCRCGVFCGSEGCLEGCQGKLDIDGVVLDARLDRVLVE
jgi:hypothetical protein